MVSKIIIIIIIVVDDASLACVPQPIIICDWIWEKPPYGIFFVKTEFDASLISSTLEQAHARK